MGKENKHHKRKENDHKKPAYTYHGKMCQSPFYETYKYEVVHNLKPETETSGAAAAPHGRALQIRTTQKKKKALKFIVQ